MSGGGGEPGGPGPSSLARNASGLSLSSHASIHRRHPSATMDVDRSAYTAGQSLSAIVNDPRADANRSWGAWLGLSLKVPDTSWQEAPAPIDTMRYPPITAQHLHGYLSIVSDGKYMQFLADRASMAQGGLAQQLMLDVSDSDEEDGRGTPSRQAAVRQAGGGRGGASLSVVERTDAGARAGVGVTNMRRRMRRFYWHARNGAGSMRTGMLCVRTCNGPLACCPCIASQR